ncbi:uncharacterized protein ARMOST_02645 [Armillaria ostoyae]|uniref:Uncharacterized protein n=1 Tax=Armillaria ostoyae TaxID=47428 RepID=A0A284QS95_ARMOS|nr:uncharacterized protein ARMOST_02645 [Armillaria ostoyae]
MDKDSYTVKVARICRKDSSVYWLNGRWYKTVIFYLCQGLIPDIAVARLIRI